MWSRDNLLGIPSIQAQPDSPGAKRGKQLGMFTTYSLSTVLCGLSIGKLCLKVRSSG